MLQKGASGEGQVVQSRTGMFCKQGALRNFAKFTGKHLCQSLFFNKVEGLKALGLEHLFLQNTSGGCF